MLIFEKLPVVFPWYDKIEKQARYKENVEKVCDYKLITPNNALLPFQFRRLSSLSTTTSWKIFEVNTGTLVKNVTTSLEDTVSFRKKTAEGYDYFYYTGKALTSSDSIIPPLSFGYYYAVIEFSDNTFFYSEVFHVPADSFSIVPIIADDYSAMKYLRIEFWNNCDLRPILYNDLLSGVSVFKQAVYLDTFIHQSEPEIFVDGTKDGNDVVIPTFQRVITKYRITDVVSDYLKVALHLLPLHANITLTTARGIDSGDIEKLVVQSSAEANGALSTVDILFEQPIVVVKAGCCDNMKDSTPGGNGRLLENGDFRILEDGNFRLLD